ncbi:MAG: PadR family transcriptional regulator [Acidobacteria bacterium]|nr:PadR family transcriptional regulator [Acidobacteriota bacterium]
MLLFAVLRLGDGAYGTAIRQEIASRTAQDLSPGAVYTALERLETRGYVASWFGEPTPERGGKRKRFYRVEAAGATALNRAYRALLAMGEGQAEHLDLLERGIE